MKRHVFLFVFLIQCNFAIAEQIQNLNDDTFTQDTVIAGVTIATAGAAIGIANNHEGGNGSKHVVPCNTHCRKDLQKILDDARIHYSQTQYQLPALTMSISLSSNQPTLNFYSGTLAKTSDIHVDQNSLFDIGSMTKSMTAAIILQLEQEGKLSLDDTVGKWLPQYHDWYNITIRQLLNMTGGVFDYSNDDADNFDKEVAKNPTKYWPMSSLADWSYNHKPNINFPAGTNWHYSNAQYTLCGIIIEAASGKTVEQNFQERIIGPLQLKNTIYRDDLIPSTLPNMTHGYYEMKGFIFYGQDTTELNRSISNTAGGVVSNSEDLMKWWRAFFSNKVLSHQAFSEMTALVCPDKAHVPNNTCKAGVSLPQDTDQAGFAFGIWHIWDANSGIIWMYDGITSGYYTRFIYIISKDFMVTISGDVMSDDSGDLYFNVFNNVYNYFYPQREPVRFQP